MLYASSRVTTRVSGAICKSSSIGRAPTLRPLVAIAQGISASERYLRSSDASRQWANFTCEPLVGLFVKSGQTCRFSLCETSANFAVAIHSLAIRQLMPMRR